MWQLRTDNLSVVHVLAPGEVGGLESVVRLMALGQRRRGHDVLLAPILPDAAALPLWATALREAGVRVDPVVATHRRNYLGQLSTLAALLRARRPDVVHTHGYHADIVAGLAARRCGIPTVTTVHGFTRDRRRTGVYQWLQRRSFRRFEAVMAVSRAMGNELRRHGTPPSRLHVVPNAFAPDAARLARAEARTQLGLRDGTYVGWVGRLSAEKGLDVMVRALPLMPADVRLSVVGDGPERRALARLARSLGVDGRIAWHGVVADAARLMTAFDVLVLSSRAEGMPIVLFEALAAQVPVVATRVGGVPDVVGDAEARLVEPEDPDALAAAISATLADADSAVARARAGRRRLEERFGVEAWLARIDDVYATAGARPVGLSTSNGPRG